MGTLVDRRQDLSGKLIAGAVGGVLGGVVFGMMMNVMGLHSSSTTARTTSPAIRMRVRSTSEAA